MLKQPTTIGPFMRTLIVFSHVAVWTGDNDVAYIIRSALTKRYDVIGMPIVTDLASTIIAFALLPLVLFSQIGICMTSFGVAKSCSTSTMMFLLNNRIIPAILSCYLLHLRFMRVIPFARVAAARFFVLCRLSMTQVDKFVFFWIVGAVTPSRFPISFRIGGTPLTHIISRFFAYFVWAFPSDFIARLLVYFFDALRMQGLIFAGAVRGTRFTKLFAPKLATGLAGKLCYWEPLTAITANFAERDGDIQHSVSLSLYHRMLSADGVIDRRSVANLADTYIVPQRAG